MCILQAAWITKCKAVIKQNFIDDIELDEEGVAEMLLDENALASMPRYYNNFICLVAGYVIEKIIILGQAPH